MTCINHPLIRPESLESREYQLTIAMRALDANTLVVLPTGLGKTAVALIVAASRLYNEGGKVLMLAPTKPLVEQHLRYFENHILLPDNGGNSPFVMFTGETPGEQRTSDWERATFIFATPQVIKNDILAGRYSLEQVTLMIIDECHRAVGNYAYVFLAGQYRSQARNPRILAMTASPGGQQDKVRDVCANVGIEQVETRNEDDADVRPYIHERDIEIISVSLPPELEKALDHLNRLLDDRLKILAGSGFSVPKRQQLSMKALNAINAQVQEKIQLREPAGFTAASVYAEIMKLKHAVGLAESQGSEVLKTYLARLASEATSPAGSKASRRLAGDTVFTSLMDRVAEWDHELHPKLGIVEAIVKSELRNSKDSRIIIFATYRDAVQLIVDRLTSQGIQCERFVGQATKDSEKGLSQKKQIEALRRFRAGEFRVLVATSVGEEGLDVPSTDLVVFYEAVPSEIRSIQRKGRTGRSGHGKIIVLVTKGTQDETFRYVSQSRERAMAKGIRQIGNDLPQSFSTENKATQMSIEEFTETIVPSGTGPAIIVDDRETSSKVVESLHTMGASISIQRLPVGDYAIGDRIIIERKTTRDFTDTLVNRDLLGQVRSLASSCIRPVLVIEGEDLCQERNIHPNAIRGTLSAIAIDLGVILLTTKDEADTAAMLLVIARRESEERGERAPSIRKPYHSHREQLESIIGTYPDIGLKNARLLLEHFGSVQGIINAGEKALSEVPGIGEKRAKKIYELSRHPYG
ncbi:MAG: DEAD/DEAH box helicase [Methanoregulaceae archaeon]|jgi:Fanconi anemia group M protein|nr:DEAD/DEAH box helicase [Methanoregulaceae archaeon]